VTDVRQRVIAAMDHHNATTRGYPFVEAQRAAILTALDDAARAVPALDAERLAKDAIRRLHRLPFVDRSKRRYVELVAADDAIRAALSDQQSKGETEPRPVATEGDQ
jgi:hypothetical protein